MTTTPADLSRASPADWDGGWLREARHCPSPNFGPRPAGAAIDLLVVHSISLPPGQYGGPEVAQLFTNTLDWDAHPYFQAIRGLQVSAHIVTVTVRIPTVSIDTVVVHSDITNSGFNQPTCHERRLPEQVAAVKIAKPVRLFSNIECSASPRGSHQREGSLSKGIESVRCF